MSRLAALSRLAQTHRPLLRLVVLAAGLLAVALAGGAPECLPDGGGC